MLSIPETGLERSNAKDAVVATLLRRWPLTARQLWYATRKRGAGLSYSAIYKAVTELVSGGAVVRNGAAYALNAEWLRRLGTLSHSAEAGLAGAPHDSETSVLPLRFRRPADLDAFVLGLMRENGSFYSSVPHCWYPLFYGPELRELPQAERAIVFKDNCLLDARCRAFLRKLGASVGVAQAPQDISVYGDSLLQVFFADSLPSEMSAAYEKAGPGPRFKSDFQARYLERKSRITALLVRNRALTDFFKRSVAAAAGSARA